MEKQRVLAFDLLRAVAALLVLGRHIIPCPSAQSAVLSAFSRAWNRGGWVGVDLFFVLSGFLVASLLLVERERHGSISISRFLVRRTMRLLPPLWLLVGATVVLAPVTGLKLGNILTELVFIQNYAIGIWGHTWSVAAEMHFYLAFTVLFAVATVRRLECDIRAVLLAFALVCLASLIWRSVLASGAPFSARRNLFPTHLRFDAFCCGAVIACLLRQWPGFAEIARRWRGGFALLGLALFAPSFSLPLEHPFVHTSGLTLNLLGAGCLLIATAGWKAPSGRLAAALGYLGRKSYSIYLWHVPFMLFAVPELLAAIHQMANWYAYAIICLGGSIAIGIIIAWVGEVPLLKLRDRFLPTRADAGIGIGANPAQAGGKALSGGTAAERAGV